MKTKLSVITVTHNNQSQIQDLVKSLKENLPENSEIIMVDSDSSDKTTKILKRDPQIKLIESRQNLGFAKGCNLGVAKSLGEYLLFLNPDTQIFPNSVSKLLNYAQNHPRVGIVAPQLILPSGQPQPSVRRLPTLKGAILENLLGIRNSYEAFVPDAIEASEVESVVGAAILVKKTVYESVGGFDENFFMYYEDLDLCRKVKRAGYYIIYLPEAKIIHQVGGSISNQKIHWLRQSAIIYHGKFLYTLLFFILRIGGVLGRYLKQKRFR